MPEFADRDFPARPYPGRRPAASYVHVNAVGRPIAPDGTSWRVDGGDELDGWLAEHGAPPTGERVPILAYGSNACPSKITWLRAELGLGPEPVVVVRASYEGLAAVWAAGHRVVDEQRPATLAAAAGSEQHAVWLATDEQRAVLDVCEGRGSRYELAHTHSGRVTLENGERLEAPLAYLGLGEVRMPLLVDGEMVRCTDVPQREAIGLVGTAARTDGITRSRYGDRLVG